MEKINERQAENIVEFSKKKNSIQRKADEIKIGEEGDTEQKNENTNAHPQSSRIQQYFSDQLTDFFKKIVS